MRVNALLSRVATCAVVLLVGTGSFPRPALAATTPSISVQAFHATGTGMGLAATVTCPAGTPSGASCYNISGDVHGNPIGQGTFSGTLNVNSAASSDNGSGGKCAPASGAMKLDFDSSTKSITLGFVGLYCDVGATPTSPNVGPTVLTGSFFVKGGSGGKFGELTASDGPGEGGAGSGTMTISGDTDDGDVVFTLAGVLVFAPK
jgi:hypothetical protein